MTQPNAENALSGIDMAELANELQVLVGKLKEAASDPEHYSALAEVSYAAQEASKQDKAGTVQRLTNLKKAGEWVLDIAKNVKRAFKTFYGVSGRRPGGWAPSASPMWRWRPPGSTACPSTADRAR